MIKIVDVYKSFGKLEVLKGINFSVAPREVVCVIGPADPGKVLCCVALTSWRKLTGAIYILTAKK